MAWFTSLSIPAVIIWTSLVWQLVTGKPAGNYPMSNLSIFVLGMIYTFILIFVLAYVKLTTIIDSEKMSFGWNAPTADLQTIYFSDISNLSLLNIAVRGQRLSH